ncbi:MAG: GNAT family N-acetyltransferase [Hyphomicrobiales bacterium]
MLNSARLILKTPTLADAPDIAKYLNRKDTAPMMSHVPYPYTLDDARQFITKTTANMDNKIFNGIYNLENSFMGIVGIVPKPTGDEIAYWLGYPFWGKGYMPEACALTITMFFKQTKKPELYVSHLLNNDKSKSVIAKLGFKYVDNVMLDCVARNSLEEAKRYKITKHEWENRKSQK